MYAFLGGAIVWSTHFLNRVDFKNWIMFTILGCERSNSIG